MTYYDSTGTTWSNWCYDTSTTASATSGTVWYLWNDTTSATTSGVYYVWQTWNQEGPATNYEPVRTYTLPAPKPETAEERAAREAREAESRRRYAEQLAETNRKAEEERKRRQAITEKATKLLHEFLTAEQIQNLGLKKWFDLVGSKGGRYRIYDDAGVKELNEKGQEVARFCIHTPAMNYPVPDEALAKKLMLEVDEELFLKTANRTAYPMATVR